MLLASGIYYNGNLRVTLTWEWHFDKYMYSLHESKCDMVKYFKIRLMYFYKPKVSENKT